MFSSYNFESIDVYSPEIIALLIFAGFLVGIVNTLAGSGTIITFTLFTLLGLPPNFANGTTRLGVILQTLSATVLFNKKRLLDVQFGLKVGIPVVLGSLSGAQTASYIKKENFELIIGIVFLLMIFFIVKNPKRWIEGKQKVEKPTNLFLQILIFFAIGFYGGFIHIGVGIFLLTGLVLNAGYDLVKANALKVFIVLLYSPVALAVFMYHGHIHYAMGLIAGIGNLLGGIAAGKLAINKGAKFIRVFLLIVMLLFSAKLLGVFDFLM